MKFNFVFLGQSVLKYRVPLYVYNSLNKIYETTDLPRANKALAGKIAKEHSLTHILKRIGQKNGYCENDCQLQTLPKKVSRTLKFLILRSISGKKIKNLWEWEPLAQFAIENSF